MTDSTLIRFAPFGVDQGEVCFSSPDTLDLCIYKGDSGRFRIKVVDSTGAPLNITGATWDADIRSEPETSTVLATLAVQIVAGATDQADVILTATESAKLTPTQLGNTPPNLHAWDLQMNLGGESTTLLAGTVSVIGDVSRNP